MSQAQQKPEKIQQFTEKKWPSRSPQSQKKGLVPVIKENKTSKTIFIGKIKTSDLEGTTMSPQLISERIRILRLVLQKLGNIEQIDDTNVASQEYLLVTFETREEGEKVFRILKRKDEIERIVNEVATSSKTISTSVLPNFSRYRFEWSDKQLIVKKQKNAYVTKLEKEETKEKVKEVKKDVKKDVKKEVKEIKQEPKKKEEPKKEEPKKKEEEKVSNGHGHPHPHTQGHTQGHTQVVDAKALRTEAEKARLQDEISYLKNQQSKVSSEITAEKERVKSRDERIEKLSEELERIENEKTRIERQLAAEKRFKLSATERLIKLEEELTHTEQEETNAQLRLSGKVNFDKKF